MKALVTTKSAIDYQVKVVVKADESGVETNGVQMSMNPFDAIAVEACVQLQEKKHITESTAITIGEDETVLRQALAMGIHNAARIASTATHTYPKAKLLADYIQKNEFDIILMGKLGIDGDHSQIPSMVAGILDLPCITNASDIIIKDKKIEVHKETDDGIAILSMPTPCIISCDLRLNTPRFVALPKLLQAKNQPIDVIEAQAVASDQTTLSVKAPRMRKGNPPTDDLDTFIQQLKDGGIIS